MNRGEAGAEGGTSAELPGRALHPLARTSQRDQVAGGETAQRLLQSDRMGQVLSGGYPGTSARITNAAAIPAMGPPAMRPLEKSTPGLDSTSAMERDPALSRRSTSRRIAPSKNIGAEVEIGG